MENDEMIPPEQALPFDPTEFFMTWSVANETASGKGREISVIRKEAIDPESSRMASFGVAVARRYEKDHVKFESFMIRWKAWSEIVLSGEIQRAHPKIDPETWCQPSLELAAVLPVTTDGEFDRRIFRAALADKLRSL